jgi:hypothetical protein
MMERIECCVVEDLLPLYNDGITSEKTSEIIKMHLKECVNCRRIMEEQTSSMKKAKESAHEDDEKIKKALISININIIARTIIMIAAIFISLFPYFYFTPNRLLLKYVPIVVCGMLGYFIYKRYAATAVSGVAAFLGFIIPPYFMSPFYILPQLMHFIEVMILLSCGYFIIYSLSWIRAGKRYAGIYVILSASVIVMVILMAKVFLPVTANRLIADEYVRRNYPLSSFKHVTTEFNTYMDNYISKYQNEKGEYISISTNSVYVMYDSRKGNG